MGECTANAGSLEKFMLSTLQQDVQQRSISTAQQSSSSGLNEVPTVRQQLTPLRHAN